MIERIWTAIKTFYETHALHYWLENYFLYLAITGLIIIIILFIIWYIKDRKKEKKLRKEERKDKKSLFKLLSKYKNKK